MPIQQEHPDNTKGQVNQIYKNGIYYRELITGKSPEIIVRNLDLSFDGKTLFTDLDFAVSYGDKVTIVGENGSGKTTFFKLAFIRRR